MNAARKQQKITPLPSSSSSSPPNASSRSAGAGSVGNKNETLATTSSSTGALGDRDVGDIVLKAKRAAASLWMVLHAQSCSLTNTPPPGHAPGSRHRRPLCCPHRGCDDMKRLLRHIRGCPASFDQLDCPRDYPGCCSVRKLMAHHKRCRALRLAASRRQSPSCTSSFPSPPPPCLICSLVARHARNILEGGSAPSPPSAGRRRDISARPRSASAAVPVGEGITSGSCPTEDDSASMPPPPPRRPRAASDIPFGIRNRGRNDAPQVNSDNATTACSSSSCSPPNESHLMRNRETRRIWTALASATGPAPCVGGGLLEHSPDLLSRSFDSSSIRQASHRVVVTPPAKRRIGARGINNNAECKVSRSDRIPSLCREGGSSKEDAPLSSQPATSASPSSTEREGSRKRRQDPASPATLTRQYQQRPRSKSEGGPSSPPPTRGTRAEMNATETRHHQQDDCTAVDNPMRSTDRPATSANGAATLLSFHRRSRSFSELEESHIWSSDHQHQQRTSYSAVYWREEEAASELHLRMDAAAAGRGGGFGADSGIECRGNEGADDVEGNEGEETGGGGASLSITGRSSSCGVLSALAHPE